MSTEQRTRRQDPFIAIWRWPKWTWAIWVAMLLLSYPASFAPACWIAAGSGSSEYCRIVSLIYGPVAQSIIEGPEFYSSPMRWYIRLGLPNDVELMDERQGVVLVFPKLKFTYTILWIQE